MIGKIKNKVFSFWTRLNRTEKIFLVVAIVLTVARILLAMKIPLHIQAAATYDDRMLVNYSANILSGKWLGEFNQFSLAKGASYSIFLAVNYLLGLAYSFSLIALYVGAVAIFCVAISKLIKNKVFLCILYSLMLYSPVMLHDENVQKIYRGGVIVIFALLVVAAMIGIYTRVEARKRLLAGWAILATISLVFFWFLKEDSIWMMPLVVGGVILSLIRIWKGKLKKKEAIRRVMLVMMPLIGLVVGMFGYKTINYMVYGEFAVTDRQGTYFKEVITDLIKIKDEGQTKDIWVTRGMFDKAYEASHTLAQVKDKIEKGYNGWGDENGEIEGDIVFWMLKDAVFEAGYYSSGRDVNDFYRKVHEELTEAFLDGSLERNDDFYISAVAKGINQAEIPEFIRHTIESLDNVISYQYNEAGVYPATGDRTGIALMNSLTMSQYIEPEVDIETYHLEARAVKMANLIVKIYKICGKMLFYVAVFGMLLFSGYMVQAVIRKKIDRNEMRIYLVLTGLIITCAALFLGTVFFCRFLSQKKVYDYASPMLPILLSAELIVVYVVPKRIIEEIKRRKNIRK